MAFFKLCSDDMLVNTLRTVFRANVIRIPEARFRPLTVVALGDNDKPQFWGYLGELLEDSLPDTQAVVEESPMADVSGKRSKSVSIDLGLEILKGFLSGFRLPSAAISAKFTGAKTVSFSFQDVMRYFISPIRVGNLLEGQALKAGHAANKIFFRRQARLLVIDSIITSKDFSISVDKASTNDFSLNIPAIEQMVGQARAGVQVSSQSSLDITFQGNTPLTFAFTYIRCDIDEAGRIELVPGTAPVNFQPGEPATHELLFEEPGMIEISVTG